MTHHKHQEKELLLNPLRAHMSGFSEIILLLAPLPPSLGHIVEISCWVPCVDKKQMNSLDFSKPSSILRTIQIRSPPNVWFRHFSPVSLRSKKVPQCPNRSNQTLFSFSLTGQNAREKFTKAKPKVLVAHVIHCMISPRSTLGHTLAKPSQSPSPPLSIFHYPGDRGLTLGRGLGPSKHFTKSLQANVHKRVWTRQCLVPVDR